MLKLMSLLLEMSYTKQNTYKSESNKIQWMMQRTSTLGWKDIKAEI